MQNPYYETQLKQNINYNTNIRDPLNQNIQAPCPYPTQTYQQQGQPNQQYPIQPQYSTNQAPYQSPPANVYVFDVNKQQALKQPDPLAHLDDGLAGQARRKFIAKVYGILILQLILTAAMCFISYNVVPMFVFQIENQWLMWVLFAIAFVVEIVIICLPAGRRHPINLILLTIFTLCFAYIISYTCSYVAYTNHGNIVSIAVVMTLSLVLALTAYAVFTRTDFTTLWGILIVIIVQLIMFMILIFAFHYQVLNSIYCTLGVILFGIYLVIDTQLIVGGRRYELSMDDYVLGAMVLYIDIINLFLFILRIMGRR